MAAVCGPDLGHKVTAASLALAEESLAGLTLQALGVGLLRAAQRRVRGFAEAGTRRLPVDPDARTWRDLVGRLTEGRAPGKQGQDSDDGKDSTDFHCNVPSLNRIRRPARRRISAIGEKPARCYLPPFNPDTNEDHSRCAARMSL